MATATARAINATTKRTSRSRPREDIAAQSTGRHRSGPADPDVPAGADESAARVAPMNARWAVLVAFYLVLGLLGAWYLAGYDRHRRGPRHLPARRRGAVDDRRPVRGQSPDLPEDYLYRYPPLLAIVIPILGWPPLWFTLMGIATVVPMVVAYRVSGPAGLLPVALLVGAWGQQLLNGNAQAVVVALLAIVPLTGRYGAIGLAAGDDAQAPPGAGGRLVRRSAASGACWAGTPRRWPCSRSSSCPGCRR